MQSSGSIGDEVNTFMHFQRLEDLRIDHDLTQADISRFLGCQREVYRRYEKGTRQIPVDLLIKLAKFYDVNLDYIVGLTNESKILLFILKNVA